MSRHQPTIILMRPNQRGAASLIVVMVLFFLLSLVAAYTGRNLIFEQRTSVNQFRAAQGFEAAEAGVEWALAMLNGGRITDSCVEGGATTANTSFRQRYLITDPITGRISPRLNTVPLPAGVLPAVGQPLNVSCVFNGTNWVCSCPINGAPVLAAPAGGGVYPAFRVRFVDANVGSGGGAPNGINVVRPGLIGIEAQGCTRLENDCLNFPAVAVQSEGRALVSAFLGLKPALATPPAAALTVSGNVAARIAPWAKAAAYNTEADRGGLALHVGNPSEAAINPDYFELRGPPGTPSTAAMLLMDRPLYRMTDAPDRIFPTILGSWFNVYTEQPAVVKQFICPAAGDCRAALADRVALTPGRIFWIDGDLRLDTAGDIGSMPDPANPSAAGPVMLLVKDRVLFTPGVRVFGFVYSRDGNWQGAGQIQGGAFIDGNLGAAAAPTVNLVGSVIDAMRMQSGSFVRIPGSWKDFE